MGFYEIILGILLILSDSSFVVFVHFVVKGVLGLTTKHTKGTKKKAHT